MSRGAEGLGTGGGTFGAIDSILGADGTAETTYVAASHGGEPLVLPAGGFVFHADFTHAGPDLVVTGADGARVVAVDYFTQPEPADIVTLDGHRLPGDLVQALAGPAAPAQYAQAAGAAGSAPEIGTVQELSGTATATGSDGTKTALSVGSTVHQGDVIETSPDGAVNILFLDGTTFALGADARMVLDELIYDAASHSGTSLMSVVTGTFVFITGEVAKTGPDAMQVRTPSGTIGIRGTKVGCNLEVADGKALCVLLPQEGGKVGQFVFSNGTSHAQVTHAYEAVLASRFDTSLAVTQLDASEVGTFFPGLLGSLIRTEAGPGVLHSGGTFLDLFTERLDLLGGLQRSDVLEQSVLQTQLVFGENRTETARALALTATIDIAEVSATGPGTAASSQLNVAPGGPPLTSATLDGFALTAKGAPFAATSQGVPVTIVQSGNTVVGMAGDAVVFRFVLDGDTGQFTFFLFRPIDHPVAGQTGAADTVEVQFSITAGFADGTQLDTSVRAVVLDAGPTQTAAAASVDEAAVPVGPVTGTLALVPGADGLKSATVSGLIATANGVQIPLTSGGQAVLLQQVDATTFQGVVAGGGVVYKLVFDPATGAYSFTLFQPLDHPAGGGTSPLDLVFQVAVTDGDNDTVVSTITVQVADSVSVAHNDANSLQEGAAVAGNVVTGAGQAGGADTVGADGANVTLVNGVAVAAAGATAIQGQFGTLTIDADGNYSYVANASVNNSAPVVDSFVYTLTDGDGDTSTATLSLTIGDANAPSAVADALQIDESLGDPDPTNPFNAFQPIVRQGNLTLNDSPGGDGFGTPRVVGLNYDDGLGAAAMSEDSATITFTGAGWSLIVVKATGDYTFEQTGPIDHAALSGIATFTYVIQDLDGSTASADFTVTILDDGIVAFGDTNAVDEGAAAPITGNVLANDDPGVDGFGAVTQLVHNGVVYDPTTPDTRPDVVSNDGTTIVLLTALGGTLEFNFLTGDYVYTAPASGSISDDSTEAFQYTVTGGDGGAATATLTIDVHDVIEPVGAFLLTNTNQDIQFLRILITREDADLLASVVSPRPQTGQEEAVQLGNGGVLFETDHSYALALKFDGGAGTTNVTDFDLIFDLRAPVLDAPGNVFLTLLDQGNIHLGAQGSGVDGVIWQIDGVDALGGTAGVDPNFTVSPAILYDVHLGGALGDVVILDSNGSNTSFSLDLGLLPVTGTVTDPADALFGNVEAIDITGSQSAEVNTLTIHPADVVDTTDAGNRLIVLGDNDTVVLADPAGWVDFNPSTPQIDPDPTQTGVTVAGSTETFNVYVTTTGAELFVDTDLTVQTQAATAMG